jgi:MFS superfamily sulfate permease-like transporter
MTAEKLKWHKENLGADVIAGIICGIMLIPQGLCV